MTFDWRNGGDFISQTYRYGESDLKSQRFLDNLINPGKMTGDALRNYLVANQETMIKVNGNQFHIVGDLLKNMAVIHLSMVERFIQTGYLIQELSHNMIAKEILLDTKKT